MKLAAWRDAIERADARLLLKKLDGLNANDVWRRLEPLIPPPQLDKASYAFQDLWESVYASR